MISSNTAGEVISLPYRPRATLQSIRIGEERWTVERAVILLLERKRNECDFSDRERHVATRRMKQEYRGKVSVHQVSPLVPHVFGLHLHIRVEPDKLLSKDDKRTMR